jgi:hypothetical protein
LLLLVRVFDKWFKVCAYLLVGLEFLKLILITYSEYHV